MHQKPHFLRLLLATLALLALCAAAVPNVSAATSTVTFEAASGTPTSYAEGGYLVTEARGEQLIVYGSGEGYSSKVVQPQNWQGVVRLVKAGGGAFSLVSFGYASGRWGDSGDATVTGTRSDGTTITQAYSFTSSKTQNTLTLNWSNLTKVEISFAGGTNEAYGAVDQFVLNDGATNPTATPVPPTATTAPAGGSGTGLRGEYFTNLTLSGSPALVRTDAQVNTDYGTGGPGSPIGSDNFSVRWSGQVEAPASGSYTFTTTSDDGVRLWVNNQQLVNNWTDHGPTDNSGTITLTAGQKYPITIEFYEKTGGAVARLAWSYPGQGQQAIPQNRLYPANGTSPTATPVPPTPTAQPGGLNVTRVRFFPRSGNAGRMIGGRFSGSNVGPTSNFVTLTTIGSAPPEGQWSEITISNSTIYRYIKYEAPPQSSGNVAEIEFYSGGSRLTGTNFGTAGSFNNGGNTFEKALDGNTATFFDAASGDDQYVGIDLGASAQVAAPSFSPAPGTYSSAQNLTISSATSGASIRYTINGSAPTCTSGTSGTSVSVSVTTTVRAIACRSSLADSSVIAATYTIGAVPTPQPGGASRIYHIGNSLTDTINYSAMRTLTQSKGNTYDFGRHMIPGAPLEWIWDHPNDGFQEPPYGLYANALPNYRWDTVTLQPFDRQLDGDTDYSKRFINLARQRAENSNTQFYIFSHWMRKNSDGTLNYDQAWLRPYTGGYDGTNETKDYYEKLVTQLRSQTGFLSKPVLIVPVGDVLYELNQRMKRGEIPGYSDVTQLYADGIHLNNVGQLVTGATFYATIYKTNPAGASYAGYDGASGSADRDITDALANTIYDAVWDIVSTHPYAGVQ